MKLNKIDHKQRYLRKIWNEYKNSDYWTRFVYLKEKTVTGIVLSKLGEEYLDKDTLLSVISLLEQYKRKIDILDQTPYEFRFDIYLRNINSKIYKTLSMNQKYYLYEIWSYGNSIWDDNREPKFYGWGLHPRFFKYIKIGEKRVLEKVRGYVINGDYIRIRNYIDKNHLWPSINKMLGVKTRYKDDYDAPKHIKLNKILEKEFIQEVEDYKLMRRNK